MLCAGFEERGDKAWQESRGLTEHHGTDSWDCATSFRTEPCSRHLMSRWCSQQKISGLRTLDSGRLESSRARVETWLANGVATNARIGM